MEAVLRDLRFALRMLVKAPGFAVVAILTLSLGIGANTAIFTVVNAVLLEPLPFKDPERLVLVKEVIPKIGDRPVNVPAPDLAEFQAHNRSFAALAGYKPDQYELSGAGTPERARVFRSTASLLTVLGVAPQLGRNFTVAEDDGGAKVALLSHALWQRRFGGDPQALGRTINLDRTPFTIIGIMPEWFEFPLPVTGQHARHTDLWVPMSLNQQELENYGTNFDYRVIARLKPGMTREQANADLQTMMRVIVDKFPPQFRNTFIVKALTQPLREQVVGGVRTLLLLLLGAVGCVLLIACANIANLLLARAAGRRREIAISLALGSTARRLVSQLLVESMLLAIVGAAAG